MVHQVVLVYVTINAKMLAIIYAKEVAKVDVTLDAKVDAMDVKGAMDVIVLAQVVEIHAHQDVTDVSQTV